MTVESRALLNTDKDFAAFADLMERNGFARSVEQMRWQYGQAGEDVLASQVLADSDTTDGCIRASYGLMPLKMLLHGRSVIGAQAIDVMTDEDLRGRGLYLRLASQAYRRAQRGGVTLVFGFPNPDAARGYFGPLRWRRVSEVPFLIRPLRSRFFARRVHPAFTRLPDFALPHFRRRQIQGITIHEVDSFDERHEFVWREVSLRVNAAVDRTANYLNWRLRDKPLSRYHSWHATSFDDVVGFVTVALEEKHGGRIGYLMELLALSDAPKARVALLRRALEWFGDCRADAVLAISGPGMPGHKALRTSGFLPVSKRFRPVQLEFGVLSLIEQAPITTTLQDWYLSYLDFDTA